MERLLPEALGQAIGQILAEQRREWERERERIETEARAQLAALNAEIANLKVANEMLRVDMRNLVDGQLAQIRETAASVKDGRDGQDGAEGPQGPQGERGPPGESVTAEEVASLVLERLPAPEKGDPGPQGERGEPGLAGADGKDATVDYERIESIIEAKVAALPSPERGEPGPQGEPGEKGDPGDAGRGVVSLAIDDEGQLAATFSDGMIEFVGRAVGPQGERGEPGIAGERGEKGDPGDPGSDGRDGIGLAGAFISRDGSLVVTLTDGTTRDLGSVVGKDGAPGRDGTDGKDGLGFDAFTLEPEWDGERTLRLKWSDAKGNEQTREWRLPLMLYREIYKADVQYEAGDAVRYGGSLWLATADTSEKPGDGCKDWRLVARAGRDGRDGAPGAKGEKGDRGPPGPKQLVTGEG